MHPGLDSHHRVSAQRGSADYFPRVRALHKHVTLGTCVLFALVVDSEAFSPAVGAGAPRVSWLWPTSRQGETLQEISLCRTGNRKRAIAGSSLATVALSEGNTDRVLARLMESAEKSTDSILQTRRALAFGPSSSSQRIPVFFKSPLALPVRLFSLFSAMVVLWVLRAVIALLSLVRTSAHIASEPGFPFSGRARLQHRRENARLSSLPREYALELQAVAESLSGSTTPETLHDAAEKTSGHRPAATQRETTESSARTYAGLCFAGEVVDNTEAEALASVESKLKALSAEERFGLCSTFLDELEPLTLVAYLRHSKHDEGDAVRRLVASARWREDFGMSTLLEDKTLEIPEFFAEATREVEWLPAGADISGRDNPVLLYRSASHAPAGRPTEEWVRFFVYQCEKTRIAHPDKQVVVLVDRVGSGVKNQDPTVLRALAPLIADHYPQLIGRVDIAPVNTILFIIWRLVCFILDDTIVEVIQLVQGDDWRDKLRQKFDRSALPERLGGTDPSL